ncbi:MAG: hypothetical protein AAGA11_17430 [Pseudomonadota bacterium]
MNHTSQSHAERTARAAFLNWLLCLPQGANRSAEARELLGYIDTLDADKLNQTVEAFRRLLVQATQTAPLPTRARRDRNRAH